MSEEDIRNTTEQIEEDRGFFPDAPGGTTQPQLLDAIGVLDRTGEPKTDNKTPDHIDLPLDKLNKNTWWMLAEKSPPNGQMTMAFNVGNSKDFASQDVVIKFSINFDKLAEIDNIKLTRKLNPYDKRVYEAIATIYHWGYHWISLRQIYETIKRRTKPPSKTDIDKIVASITKMMYCHILVDNAAEAAAYRYDQFVYEGALLPCERISGYIKGHCANSLINVFREPPLMAFARGRGQITTIKAETLDTPLSQTEANLALEDYIFERLKSKALPPKILLKSLYDQCLITTAKEKKRTLKDKLPKLFDHLVKCGEIAEYKITATAIEFVRIEG